MSDEEPPNNNKNYPDSQNEDNSYLEAILKIDFEEDTGKINYEAIFNDRDMRLKKNGKR